ncbi:hypothetical protein L1887_57915 [Cichorium endivia]|nr:hypothetical protein L1887_57915 [Cichorium endivia]
MRRTDSRSWRRIRPRAALVLPRVQGAQRAGQRLASPMRQDVPRQPGQVPQVRPGVRARPAARDAQQEAPLSGSASDAQKDSRQLAGWVPELLYKEVPRALPARLQHGGAAAADPDRTGVQGSTSTARNRSTRSLVTLGILHCICTGLPPFRFARRHVYVSSLAVVVVCGVVCAGRDGGGKSSELGDVAWRDGGRDFFLGEAKFLEEQQLSVTGKKKS